MDAKTAVGLLKDHNYRTGWQNAKEIADFIEQQANSIKDREVRENYSANCAIELSKKVGQLESQVAVMHGALGNVKLSVHKAHREKSISDTYYDLIIFGNINPLLESTPEELVQKLQELEKFAELGRLALTTKAMVCSNNDFIKRGAAMCEDHCVNFKYCNLRAELLENKKD